MKIQESGEMYLESILLLKKQKINFRSVDLASHTGYSKPSISRAIGLLKAENLITVSEEGYIDLTDKGAQLAERIYERHTFLTEFFQRLGVPIQIADEDACKIEHVISEESFEALKRFHQE